MFIAARSGKDEGLLLSDFDIPEVTAAVRSGSQGLRELVRNNGRNLIAVFVRLDVLGWYYVVELDVGLLHKH